MKLIFVLAESALELIPEDMWKAASVVSDSRRRGVEPGRILLDRSLHHSAMLKLKDSERRGRPDLVHITLLDIAGTPLYLDGRVRVLVHTYDDKVLEIAERTRIPKSFFRFRGLAEKVLSGGSGEGLIRVSDSTIKSLLRRIAPDLVVGFSVQGRESEIEELANKVAATRSPCVIVGGFPRGHFSPETQGMLQETVRIDKRPLEAHVVASRLLYEVEKASRSFND